MTCDRGGTRAGEDAEARIQFLTTENEMLRTQLAYVQSRLRQLEMAQAHVPHVQTADVTCSRCTFINSSENGKCEMCGLYLKRYHHSNPYPGPLETDGRRF